MIRAQDLKGVVAMMPAFTTKDGASPHATDTVDAETLTTSVDKIIRDGANAIATMGSFGEFHTLLWEEKKKLIEATISAARQRVPVFIGRTAFNKRDPARSPVCSGSGRRRSPLRRAVLLSFHGRKCGAVLP